MLLAVFASLVCSIFIITNLMRPVLSTAEKPVLQPHTKELPTKTPPGDVAGKSKEEQVLVPPELLERGLVEDFKNRVELMRDKGLRQVAKFSDDLDKLMA